MTVSEKLAAIAAELRSQYGTNDQYSLVDMAKGVAGLHVHNYFDLGQSYDTSVDKESWKFITGLNLDAWNKLSGQTVTVSFDISWEGFHTLSGSSNRFGLEWGIFTGDTSTWISCWYFPTTANGQKHVVSAFTVPVDRITKVEEGDFFNQVNPECRFKATNFKLVVNPFK